MTAANGNLQLLIDNLHDAATLTATTEALAVVSTQDQRRDFVWESDGTAPQVITGTLPTAEFGNVFSLARHNLTAAATVRLLLKNNGAEVYDSGAVSVAEFIPAGIWRAGIDRWMATYNDLMPSQMVVLDFPSVVFDVYEIMIEDAGNPDGFFHLARIAIGQAYTAKVNFSYGATFGWVENTEHQRMSGGGLYTGGDLDGRARRVDINLDWLSRDDRVALDVELSRAGQGRDMLVRAYPESGGAFELLNTFMGKRVSALTFSHNHYDNFKFPLTLEEC